MIEYSDSFADDDDVLYSVEFELCCENVSGTVSMNDIFGLAASSVEFCFAICSDSFSRLGLHRSGGSSNE